ncbi:MFS transporter [Oceanobacillus senegalensis]|uniref:MFS transporter n=1 Tax=Oceanobacillus senegalensis TaxID=1936063 RepID=UPI000A3089BA|nr:glycoside-pentoside-hexuronide (GPH):cation symporter [Oceanobacillus senegalensis]
MSKNRLSNGTNQSVRPFGLRDKIGYLFGDFGNDFSFILVSTFLMVFYTDVFGISAAAVGTLFLVARFWDAVTDVLWGRFIDSRKNTPKGKFRPWIFRMSLPLVISSALMFVYIPGMSDGFYLAYAYVTYILWGMLYTSVNIPYGSMAAVISGDSTDRSSLSGWRTMGATAAGLIINAGAPLIVFVNNDISANRMLMMAIIFSILAFACYMGCVNLTTERIQQPERKPGEKLNFKKTVKGLVKNTPLITILIASLLFIMTMMLVMSINVYLFKDYFESATALSAFTLIQSGAVLFSMPALTPLVKRFGKKEVAAGGMFVAGTGYLILFMIPNISLPVFLTVNVIGLFGFAFFNLIIWAFVTDAIDYQEYLTGSREDGTVYAIYSFARKVGQAFAGGLTGYALTFVGYNSGAETQTEQVKDGIYTVATLVPSITYFVVFLILVFAYPLNKKRTKQLEINLAEKREERKKAV